MSEKYYIMGDTDAFIIGPLSQGEKALMLLYLSETLSAVNVWWGSPKFIHDNAPECITLKQYILRYCDTAWSWDGVAPE